MLGTLTAPREFVNIFLSQNSMIEPRRARHYAYRVMAKAKKARKQAVLLGLGLDSDGHKRLTTGPNFVLVGGSEGTHEDMTEKAIKINEKLASKGKELHEVSREEFDDIAHSVGLRRPDPGAN